MNSQQIIVKAHFNGNIRRFQSQALWTVLSKDLQALFSFDPNMRVKTFYRDDENDMCQISSQMELEFAASQYSPLQIFLQPDQAVNSTEVVVEAPSVPNVLPLQPLTPSPLRQSAPVRCDRLNARLACIEKKLASPTLPAQKREKLTQKKSKLEEAIRSRSPVEAPVLPVEAPQVQQAPLVIPTVPEQTKRCGRRNPSERLAQIDRALSQPNLHPKRLERLQQQKAKIEEILKSDAPDVVDSSPVPEVVVLRGPAARLLAIEKILAQPDLPPRRAEKLNQKKARIEEFLRKRAEKESSVPVQQEVISAPSPCRGPEARLAAITKMLESNELPPHRVEKLMQQKARIEQRLTERVSVRSENCCRGRRRDQFDCEKPRARLAVVRRK